MMAAALRDVRQRVASGESVADAFAATGVFPSMAVSMVDVGERTGALAEMLERLAAFYEQSVEAATRDLLSLLEPLLMLAVGAVIAGVVIAMYLPVFEMMSVV
jgi:type IV pilus assembly protein PilC